MGINWRRPAQRFENLGLPKGIREMIVAADSMGNSHIMVVHDDRQHIGWCPVGPKHDEIVHFAVGDVNRSLNGVIYCGFPVPRRFETDNGRNVVRSVGQIAVAPGTVVPHGAFLGLGLFPHGLEFLGRTVTGIGKALVQQLLNDFGVSVPAGELKDRVFVRGKPKPV